MEEMAVAGSRTERMAEAVMEWRVLLKSLLEGIKEIQLAIGHLVVSKRVHSVQPAGKPLIVTVTMKELGVDLHRLDQKSPAHQMYDINPNLIQIHPLIKMQVFFSKGFGTSGIVSSHFHLYQH